MLLTIRIVLRDGSGARVYGICSSSPNCFARVIPIGIKRVLVRVCTCKPVEGVGTIRMSTLVRISRWSAASKKQMYESLGSPTNQFLLVNFLILVQEQTIDQSSLLFIPWNRLVSFWDARITDHGAGFLKNLNCIRFIKIRFRLWRLGNSIVMHSMFWKNRIFRIRAACKFKFRLAFKSDVFRAIIVKFIWQRCSVIHILFENYNMGYCFFAQVFLHKTKQIDKRNREFG